ncbi:hypothetical protein CVT25_015103 [Psilocybe cyanescens]|uniref:Uncharacterized protein n=1 Tax=Psilocybe cyanescens TaxID=93625 RepID=A0A409WUI3_PSICY|nr:hypothetical protein CVT25_015103 [Psilocybe cyanescens]
MKPIPERKRNPPQPTLEITHALHVPTSVVTIASSPSLDHKTSTRGGGEDVQSTTKPTQNAKQNGATHKNKTKRREDNRIKKNEKTPLKTGCQKKAGEKKAHTH